MTATVIINSDLKKTDNPYYTNKEDIIFKKLTESYTYHTEGEYKGWPSGTKKLLDYVYDNIEGDCVHLNYADYLTHCWCNHIGVVVNPDIIWYTLLCEVTKIVSENQDKFRNLFTTSNEKETICFSGGTVIPPLDEIVEKLKQRVPTDTQLFLPEFSTTNKNSRFAHYAAFSDIVSPYYSFAAWVCGIPAVRVEGEESDWVRLRDSWKELGSLFVSTHQEYVDRVYTILDRVIKSFKDKIFWKNIIGMEFPSCDDAHILGWFTSLFIDIPVRNGEMKRRNHISSFKYKLNNQDREMKTGLFSSVWENGFLVPKFSQVVFSPVQEPIAISG